jgi:hypothetical protein
VSHFINSLDLEIATIRRRNLLTAISGLTSASCSLKDPEAAMAELSGLVAECDREIEQLNRAMQAQEDV